MIVFLYRLFSVCAPFGPRTAMACLVALAGCGGDYAIQLASADERLPNPSFLVGRKGSSDEQGLRYSTIVVKEAAGVAAVWETSRLGSRPSAPGRIVYGEDPAKFERRTFSQLKPNTKYLLLLRGPGEMTGRFAFRLDASGSAVAD